MPEPNAAKDLEFLLACVKSSTGLTIDYDEVATMLGWKKQKVYDTMCKFRKQHDWQVSKDGVKALKIKTAKRAADDGEVKKPAKRAKKAAKAEEADKHEETPAANEQMEYFEEGAEGYLEQGVEGEYVY